MSNENNGGEKKYFYFFISCVSLLLLVIGATMAYFMAGATDNNTITGNSATVSFSLFVNKVTSVDMAFGLIPMYDDRVPYAADKVCLDDAGNPVCQIYKITVKADSSTIMFLDGYIVIQPKEGVDVAFARVFPVFEESNDEEESAPFEGSPIKYMASSDFSPDTDVGNGIMTSEDITLLNHTDDASCIFVSNDKIGGDSLVNTYYAMVWLHDTGISQDDIQGLFQAYTGTVVFTTAEGNEISASFD